jgi:hypothetical protein
MHPHVSDMMPPSMTRLLTGSTTPLAPMGQAHVTHVALAEVRLSIGVSPNAMTHFQTG